MSNIVKNCQEFAYRHWRKFILCLGGLAVVCVAFAGYVYLGNAEDEEKCLFRAVIVDRDNSFRDLNRNRFEYNDDNLTKKMLYTDSIGYQIEKEG